jgi:hypothetical protein
MSVQAPLTAQVATLRTALRAVAAPCWLPGAVHAMIMDFLLHLFGRLEEIFRLWQSGAFAPVPVARPSHRVEPPALVLRAPQADCTPRPAQSQDTRRDRQQAEETCGRAPLLASIAEPSPRPIPTAPSHSRDPRPLPGVHHARAPPRPHRPHQSRNRLFRGC